MTNPRDDQADTHLEAEVVILCATCYAIVVTGPRLVRLTLPIMPPDGETVAKAVRLHAATTGHTTYVKQEAILLVDGKETLG